MIHLKCRRPGRVPCFPREIDGRAMICQGFGGQGRGRAASAKGYRCAAGQRRYNKHMRAIRRILTIVLGGALVLAAIVLGGGYLWLRGSLPQTEGEVRIAALDAPVTIRRNADGMVRIQAANELDLYRALGFVHAQDRLWQMDFMRRSASGRLSEVMGDSTLSLDRFFRTLGLR